MFHNCGIHTPKAALSGSSGLGGGGFDHSTVLAQACADCHEKDRKDSSHFAGQDCKGCHVPGTTWKDTQGSSGGALAHNPIPTACNSCHSDGQAFDRYPANHLPVLGGDCIECHANTIAGGFRDFTNSSMKHIQPIIDSQNCNSCHADGQPKDSFPAGHTPIGGDDCFSCHYQQAAGSNFTSWGNGTFEHDQTIINGKNCNSCHTNDRPNTGAYMSQDPALTVNTSHYGQFDCYYCHGTNNQFRDWSSTNTSHYNASGGRIESCLPCHYSRERPQANQASNGRIGEHSNRTTWFMPPIYDINAAGDQPGRDGKLGNCFSCHTRRRSFAD